MFAPSYVNLYELAYLREYRDGQGISFYPMLQYFTFDELGRAYLSENIYGNNLTPNVTEDEIRASIRYFDSHGSL